MSPVVGHKEPLSENKPIYFKGSFAVLSKHKFKTCSLLYNYLRKFMIGSTQKVKLDLVIFNLLLESECG